MRKLRKIMKIGIIVLIIIILSISFANRVIYGTWNSFSYPNRITYGGYYYTNNGVFVTLTGDKRPQYELTETIIDRITGKRIYSSEKNFQGANGTEIFLHLEGDKYLVLSCGGGG